MSIASPFEFVTRISIRNAIMEIGNFFYIRNFSKGQSYDVKKGDILDAAILAVVQQKFPNTISSKPEWAIGVSSKEDIIQRNKNPHSRPVVFDFSINYHENKSLHELIEHKTVNDTLVALTLRTNYPYNDERNHSIGEKFDVYMKQTEIDNLFSTLKDIKEEEKASPNSEG